LQVEIDRKGRVLLPSKVRKKVRARVFELRVEDSSTIIMEGLRDPEAVRGKYKGLLKGKSIRQIEEEQEMFISRRT
jgi:DNA-binding transcriptional regulator/RsmH inhibitor MraZ